MGKGLDWFSFRGYGLGEGMSVWRPSCEDDNVDSCHDTDGGPGSGLAVLWRVQRSLAADRPGWGGRKGLQLRKVIYRNPL